MSSTLVNRTERRTIERIRLSNPIVGRLGTMGVILIDISSAGARVEHYNRFATGTMTRLRFQWEGEEVSAECRIVSCKVHRFSPGDDGLTVYQSGLILTDPTGESAMTLKRMVTAHITRALAEQVANLRGVPPVFDAENMPIFRDGVLTTDKSEITSKSRDSYLLPTRSLVLQRGFITCTFKRKAWQKRWSMNSGQPEEEGFTVSANEQPDQIDRLCEAYQLGNDEHRHLIRVMAEMSVADAIEREK